MSVHDDVDLARGWMFVEKLIAEEDAMRVEALGDDELEKEMRAGGYDPALVPSAEELLARVEARAAQRAVWEMASEAQDPAPVFALADRRPTRWALWLVAAMFGVLLLVMASRDRAVLALFRHKPTPDEIEPNKDWRPAPPPPTPHEQAEALRDEAETQCRDAAWRLCRIKLDEAKALDPSGESEPRVQAARSEIRSMVNPPPDKGPK